MQYLILGGMSCPSEQRHRTGRRRSPTLPLWFDRACSPQTVDIKAEASPRLDSSVHWQNRLPRVDETGRRLPTGEQQRRSTTTKSTFSGIWRPGSGDSPLPADEGRSFSRRFAVHTAAVEQLGQSMVGGSFHQLLTEPCSSALSSLWKVPPWKSVTLF